MTAPLDDAAVEAARLKFTQMLLALETTDTPLGEVRVFAVRLAMRAAIAAYEEAQRP